MLQAVAWPSVTQPPEAAACYQPSLSRIKGSSLYLTSGVQGWPGRQTVLPMSWAPLPALVCMPSAGLLAEEDKVCACQGRVCWAGVS